MKTERRRRSSQSVAGSQFASLAKSAQAEIQPSTLPLEKDDDRVAFLRRCVAPHVDSFDFAIGSGLMHLSQELEPIIVRGPADKNGKSVHISLRAHSLSVRKPSISTSSGTTSGISMHLYPFQCRRASSSYVGELFGAFTVVLDKEESFELPIQRIGRVPIMVGSTACHLKGKSRSELVALGEEEYEVGGYFVINGSEKVMRLVVVPRSNHAVSARRDKNSGRGPLFTDLSLSYRSMRRDLSTFTLHFHLLRSGTVRIRVTIARSEYFIPIGVAFRAILSTGTTDREIYDLIVGGERDDNALRNAAIAIIKELSERSHEFRHRDAEPNVKASLSKSAATAYLGKSFRAVMGLNDELVSDHEAGVAFLRRFILVHLSVGCYENPDDALDRSKVDLMVLLVRKLVSTSTGDIEVDDADALSHQSLMPPGQLYLSLLKEKVESLVRIAASYIRREAIKGTDRDKRKVNGKRASRSTKTSGPVLKIFIKEAIKRAVATDQLSTHMSYLLATGNIKTDTGLDLPQAVGYSVIAERINFLRFISHFRAVHRGAFYALMRSTKVRKLLPEAWGFICPVHTPDGDPCGILNHLAAEAVVTQGMGADKRDILHLFSDFNFYPAPALSSLHSVPPKDALPVVVDGRVFGYVREESAEELAEQIRYTKIRDMVPIVSNMSEVVYVRRIKAKAGFAPGIYVHTTSGRLMRPVKWLQSPRNTNLGGEQDPVGFPEWIGSLEQVFLRVRPSVQEEEGSLRPIQTDGATHAEVSSVSFLSVLASLSPFPDMNQGPRNMFQCQMAKQTMGTPCHTTWSRHDSKVYRHTTPQVPITRNFCMQDPMGADVYPNGVNAVVAVISYSGNDMEDALVINKGSLDRGFAHGTVYVNEKIDLDRSIDGREKTFATLPIEAVEEMDSVDMDGLPRVGSRVKKGSPLYGICGKDHLSRGLLDHKTQWTRYKYQEDGTVDEVVVVDPDMYKHKRTPRGPGIRQANVRIRVSRTPCVGDKFASRAGQKGTMSAAWPSEDMPFSESGMVPDILFNPNGFPSRMTIGMMVEIMSGKAGALHGHFNDSTPFRFDESHRAVDFFAEQLLNAGFDACGSEVLYSGYTGEPFKVNIFTGVVHYQRLRHMVSDKFQVRTTGAIDPLFRQPIKGRSRGGAIRFGEMERDGLIAHGASFLLRDRLAMASDMHLLHVCETCGSLVSPTMKVSEEAADSSHIYCRECVGKESQVLRVAIPYSMKYLTNELAAMNIRTVFKLKEVI
ncbi:RNA Polymerase IV Small Subunit [Chondrus crispus]|uniref:DNA-directed RNA polymerase subunit beta n=1 Tax=Chondrus crispus TaxID=2769 RepID=R7Q7W5_CHOCR|nr:RNA Polymerase IV Small Subunit [Chondrus crispus]CDF33913.1 RNA Polymerase IV Small Subunit [Chondrus crispus]|eukprot:XP_005713733.1 RNA Polymerase IV Small Subunit [Chondrus crispus]